MMSVLIKNAHVVLPYDIVQAHVLVCGGRIAAIGTHIDESRAQQVIDLTGLHLLPGILDTQVHLREPGLTHKEDLRARIGAWFCFYNTQRKHQALECKPPQQVFATLSIAEPSAGTAHKNIAPCPKNDTLHTKPLDGVICTL